MRACLVGRDRGVLTHQTDVPGGSDVQLGNLRHGNAVVIKRERKGQEAYNETRL